MRLSFGSYKHRERRGTMDNRKIIQQGLDYIEENLRTEITAAELAEMAHISLFH